MTQDPFAMTLRLDAGDLKTLTKLSEYSKETVEDLALAAMRIALMDLEGDRPAEARLTVAAAAIRLSKNMAEDPPPEPKARW